MINRLPLIFIFLVSTVAFRNFMMIAGNLVSTTVTVDASIEATELSVYSQTPESHMLFSYGSNNIKQLEERTGANGLVPRKAYLPDHIRIYGGYSGSRIGAPAAVYAQKGKRAYGSVVKMTEEELTRLDWFEGTHSNPPIYKREKSHVYVIEEDGKESIHECFIYMKQEMNFLSYPNYEAYLIPIELHFHTVNITPQEDDLNHIHVLTHKNTIRRIHKEDIKTDYLFLYDGAFEHGQLPVHSNSNEQKRMIDLHALAPQKAYVRHHTRIFAGTSARYGSTPSGLATLHPSEGDRIYGVMIHMHASTAQEQEKKFHKNDLLATLDKHYRVDQRAHALYKRELMDVYPVMTTTSTDSLVTEEVPRKCFVYIKISSEYKLPPNEHYLQNMRDLMNEVAITEEDGSSLNLIRYLTAQGEITSMAHPKHLTSP